MKQQQSIKGRLWIFALLVVLSAVICLTSALSYRSGLKLTHPVEYEKIVDENAQIYGVPKSLILAVIKTESNFQPDAQSDAGAQGLMQITPDTFAWLQTKLHVQCEAQAVFEPETAILFGTFFLQYLLEEFGDTQTALAAYHAGRGKVHEWLEDAANSQDGKILTHIPSAETAHYVQKVCKAEARYHNLYEMQ